MQELIKFIYTIITTILVFLSSVFIPADIKPQTENFDFTYLHYPEEAAISLEEAGLTVAEFTYRADAELEGINANGKKVKREGLRFTIGKNCDVEFLK